MAFQPFKKHLFVIFTAAFVFLAIVPIVTYAYFVKDLKSKDTVINRNNTGVTLLDRYNHPFFTFFSAKNKVYVPLSDISSFAETAIIVSEDKEFYQHPGFSIRGILRSLLFDIKRKDAAFGGSTITQQLVKNALLNSNKSFLRKYQEIILAQEIERRFTKNEILEMYLNSVYFGEGAFGIEEASKVYFGKHAKDLVLGESAFLAALLPAPSELSPYSGDINKAYDLQKIILGKMVEQNYITKEQKNESLSGKLTFQSGETDMNSIGAHFALMTKDSLIQQYGEETISRSGFTVRTTLDLGWQVFAEQAVRNQVENLVSSGVTNGAAVVIDPKTGEVKVFVGSKDWYDNFFGKMNMAISPRQPGSSFKPIVYVDTFEQGILTPASILHDIPTTYPGNYNPRDFDGRFRGLVTVRRALSNSLNVPAVEALSKLGVANAVLMAQKLGITTLKDPSNYGLSLVLGAGEVKLLELTNVYATFANEGIKNNIITVLDIKDKYGNEIYKLKKNPERVLSKGSVFLISSILSDNSARSEEFGNLLTISRPAAVKTGTSEDYRDSLTLGYTPSLAIGVWVGNNDRAPMSQIAGSLGAAPIWKALMEKFLEGTPVEQFTQPGDVVKAFVCNFSSNFKNSTPSVYFEYFLNGTQPGSLCVPTTPTPSPFPTITLSPTLFKNPTPIPFSPPGNPHTKLKKNF